MRSIGAWSLSGLLWAQALTGDLVIFSETGEPFRLYLNGEWVAETPVTRAEAHDLPAGPQRAVLYIHPSEGRILQLRRTLHVEEDFVEYFALRKKKGQYTLALSNRVPRSEVAPPPVGQPPTPVTPQPPTSPAGAPTQNQSTTIVFNPTIQVQTGGGTQVNAPPTGQTPQPGSPLPPTSGSGYVGPCNCTHPTPSTAVQELLTSLRQESFDDTKLEIAKTFVQQNCLWSRDVRSLLEALTYEKNKLTLAKWAYAYVHDVGAYATVAQALSFSSSREELMQYVRSQPARYQCQGTVPGGGAMGGTALPPCQPCMPAQNFSQALSTIRYTSSEPARLQVALQVAATNCLTARQVREICQAFTSEESRLTFAKEAYRRCCDRENYFIVHEAFVSVASREALSQYIQSLGGR